MSTDFKLGEIGEYVLLFLEEQVDENNQVDYMIHTPQRIVTLRQVYQADRDKTLQFNNLKDMSNDEAYYVKCFDEIKRGIKNIESKTPIYISECITGGRYEIEGFIKNNYTYIALKDLEEVFGVQVKWQAKTHTIVIKDDETTIELFPNSKKILVNNIATAIDTVPIIENGKSYLPVRMLVQVLGKDISYKKQGNVYMYYIHEDENKER